MKTDFSYVKSVDNRTSALNNLFEKGRGKTFSATEISPLGNVN